MLVLSHACFSNFPKADTEDILLNIFLFYNERWPFMLKKFYENMIFNFSFC